MKRKIKSRNTTVQAMPSVGTRRSTRGFVPKSFVKSLGGGSARVLRSGKRILSESTTDDWFKRHADSSNNKRFQHYGRFGSTIERTRGESRREIVLPASVENDLLNVRCSDDDERRFGIVYKRKRKRVEKNITSDPLSCYDRMYGISFIRKKRRTRYKGSCLSVTSRKLKAQSKGGQRAGNLVVLVEFPTRNPSYFPRFLVSVMRSVMKPQFSLWELAAFLCSDPISGVFSRHGIQFMPINHSSSDALGNNSDGKRLSSAGVCKIFGAQQYGPIFTLNFSTLPLYFTRLYQNMLLDSLRLPTFLAKYFMEMFEDIQEFNSCHTVPKSIVNYKEQDNQPTIPSSSWDNVVPVVNTSYKLNSNKVSNYTLKTRGQQRRRSSLRSNRSSLANLQVLNGSIRKMNNAAKVRPLQDALEVSACSLLKTCNGDILTDKNENGLVSSGILGYKPKKSGRKAPVEAMKEMKSVLSELKQDLNSVHCKTNILIVESDRCWREQGGEVMLEFSEAKEWCLSIKVRGEMRYLHKPQEMRQSTTNRYTHAMIWNGENGWKLEFCDRKDWLVFKELHRECCDRNVQTATLRIIPVPGVREVSGYENSTYVPFVRPSMYITTKNDEVERTLLGKDPVYDMDSADEEWLHQLNSSCPVSGHDPLSHITEDNFENIIDIFEKTAYSQEEKVSDKNTAVSLCANLGSREMMEHVFDYWVKKKKMKRSPLLRVFQGQPHKRTQLTQQPFSKKKRSLKRQASQVGRGKQAIYLKAEAEQQLKRIQAAESAANSAMEFAILKRKQAQMLMHNADLLVYKSLMALKLIEAKDQDLEEDPNSASSFIMLDCD